MRHLKTVRLDLDLRESLGRRLRPEAVVVQEDRNLVMSRPAELDLDHDDDLDAAYRAIAAHRPLPLGRYLLCRPREEEWRWTYQAVVHDLEARPTSRPGDVKRSLTSVLRDAERRGVSSLAVEPLGVWQDSGLAFPEMVEAFDDAVIEVCAGLESAIRLTLVLGGLTELEEVSHLFRSSLLRRASRSFRTVNGDAAVVEVCAEGARFHCRFVPGSLSGYLVTRVAEVA